MSHEYQSLIDVIMKLKSVNVQHATFKTITPSERNELILDINNNIFNHRLLDDIVKHFRLLYMPSTA